MTEPEKHAVSGRHKKACTECRQQKAKCDAYMHPDAPCSRCQKVGATCVISDPFKREHKRKRLSQLEREAEDLRKRLHGNNNNSNNNRGKHVSPVGAGTELSRTPRSLESSTPGTSPSQSIDPLFQSSSIAINARPAPVALPETTRVDPDHITQARALKGMLVEAHEIDEIFRLFFQDYAPFLPVLDPSTSPNGYYEQSPLLFWTVIIVASRSYSKNPTLFSTLADPVFETILLSMKTNATPVYKIQSFLLFLTWPLPTLELPFPLSGWLLHLAMQNGLHMPMASHEFGRNIRVSALDPPRANRSILTMDMQRRSELWAYCIVVYQRACLQKGQPPRTILGLIPETGQKLCLQVPPALALQLRCLDIVSKCSTSIFALGVRNTSAEHERSMTLLIRAHETQIDDLLVQLPQNHNTLYPAIAQLQVQVFYLYKDLTGSYDRCFSRLVSTACSVIEHMKLLFDQPETYAASPFFATNGLVLACSCLLRLLKSSMASHIDAERSKNYLFTGIRTLKLAIIEPNDFASKCMLAINQVWNSTRAFRKSDGSEYSTLRIRSRLVMSPVIDVSWWWREEFESDDALRRVETESEDKMNRQSASDGSGAAASNPAAAAAAGPAGGGSGEYFSLGNSEFEELQFLNDEFLTDFEWSLGNNFLVPTDGYADFTWPAAGNTDLGPPLG